MNLLIRRQVGVKMQPGPPIDANEQRDQLLFDWMVEVAVGLNIDAEIIELAIMLYSLLCTKKSIVDAEAQLYATACLSLACKGLGSCTVDSQSWLEAYNQQWNIATLNGIEWSAFNLLDHTVLFTTITEFLHLMNPNLAQQPQAKVMALAAHRHLDRLTVSCLDSAMDILQVLSSSSLVEPTRKRKRMV
jgi:hypothetical protein